MKQSMTYQLSMKFHKKIIGRVVSEDTRRRRFYYLGLKGGRLFYTMRVGTVSGYNLRQKLLHKPIPWEKVPVPSINYSDVQKSDDRTPIATSVSVIIPTKIGGPDFQRQISRKILRQKGIQTTEIVIIDSGSTDTNSGDCPKLWASAFSR
ncbi:MAG: hypothetical protein MZV63_12270 [Marinilabiliales bacterium]|nr:hypothetical protein [Marinilabiliales bacterium]